MTMKKLTDKQDLYCRKYIELLNQRQAYMAAYDASKMKPNTVDRHASTLHQMPHIQARINELMAEREQRLQIDADYVLRRLVEIDQMDLLDILDEKMAFRPISDWPKVWRQYLSGVDVSELFEGVGDEREMVGVLKKIKWPDKVKNLELLGKHVRVGAFKETIDHTSSDGSMTPTVIQLVGPADDDSEA
jgi:phage terminase small subunit